MFKQLLVIVLTTALLSFFANADENADDIEALEDEIGDLVQNTEDNRARLQELMLHPHPDVHTKARMYLARLIMGTGDYDEAERILSRSNESQSILSQKNRANLLIALTALERMRNDFVKAKEYAFQAVEVSQGNNELLGEAYLGYGTILSSVMDWIDAKRYLELSLEAFIKENDDEGKSVTLNQLGVMYVSLGDLSKALEYLHQSRVIIERIGNEERLATVYYNIGEVYEDSNEPANALVYYEKALAMDKKIGGPYNISYSYIGIANIHIDLEKYSNALKNNAAAIEVLGQIDSPRQFSRAYLQRSNIFATLDNQAERLQNLQLAKKYADIRDSPFQTLSVDYSFGDYFFDTKEYSKALPWIKNSLAIAEELSLDNKKREAHELLARTYQALGQIDKAFFHLEQTLELQELLNTEDQREKTERYKRDMNLLEEELKVSELEQIKVQKEQELRTQENLQQRLHLVILCVVALSLAIIFVLWQRRKLSLLRVSLYENTLRQKNQLLADVSHELRTPLTALQLKVEALKHNLVDDVDASYERLIEKISDINRMISDIYQLAQSDIGALNMRVTEEDISELFAKWQDEFRDLVQMRAFEWLFENHLPSSQSISIDKDRIKQVLANLINNSLAYTDSPGEIKLTAKITDKFLSVYIEDSKPGVAPDELPKLFERLFRVESSRSRETGGSGLGLSICKSIIEAHKGKITASSSELGGLLIDIKLPLRQESTND